MGFLLLRQRDSLTQSLLDCARRLRRRTLRCTLHYASKLARSRCKANLSFSAKKTRRFSRVFCRPKRDSVQSKYDCTRLRRRTLRCTLHYASKLARSRCKANLSFSKTRGAEEMFVAGQQLTSLSPRREIPCNQTNIDCTRRLCRRTLRCTLHYA